jgi:hypothetical protein
MGGGTARQPQQRDRGDDQGQLKVGIAIDNHISSHSFAVYQGVLASRGGCFYRRQG